MSKYKKINPELKQQWIDALESGKYKQGNGWLRSKDDKFCCLGVLCDIVDPNGWQPYEDTCISDGIEFKYNNNNMTAIYTISFKNNVGISSKVETKLASMNDDKIEINTFIDIADWIRKNI